MQIYRNLSYIFRHKWFTMLECWKMGLYWRGVVHDLSKLTPSEFSAYAQFFWNADGSNKQIRDKTGYYKPIDTGNEAFDLAWLHHQARNDHHWQYWCVPDNEDQTKGVQFKTYQMPEKVWKEMICDWRGAGRAQKSTSVIGWYEKNKDKMVLHPETRKKIEEELYGK
jgi:hypothetical protein